MSERRDREQTNFDPIAAARVLEGAVTLSGHRLLDLSESGPVLLVFLRHAGCTFCRETLADLAERRQEIESNGTHIIIVHMGPSAGMEDVLKRYGLESLDRIIDSTQDLYHSFGLKRGTLSQLFGLKVLKRAFIDGALLRHGIGSVQADSTQMPGLFLLYKGAIVRRFRHLSVADRPDYSSIAAPVSL